MMSPEPGTPETQGRLTNVEIDGTMAATYTYDALGRRISIDDSGTKIWTVYNGDTADDNPYADFTASGSLQTRYLDGLAVDELFARTSASGVTAWYLRDNVGSFYADVTTTMVLDAVIYDPYGNIVTETNASEGDRFKFAGMEYDSVTGLYYDHARYYDAAIGRFVSQDPMGFAAGDANLYRYVQNCPTTQADTSGEAEHEKGARKSTSNDHDYGQSRQQQDKNNPKPNHRSYKRYTDPKPPSAGPQQEGPKVHINKYPQGTDGGDNPPNRGGTPTDGGDGGYYTIIAGSGLIFVGAVLAAGTIVEDIITFGGGIIDDPPSFAAAGIMVAKGGQMLLR
jgi:RHS repeat-associated protein